MVQQEGWSHGGVEPGDEVHALARDYVRPPLRLQRHFTITGTFQDREQGRVAHSKMVAAQGLRIQKMELQLNHTWRQFQSNRS